MSLPAIWNDKEIYAALIKKVVSQVEFEIGQIDQLFVAYDELLLQVQESQPNLIEITALASVLHSFYNGIENIFLSIAKGIDKQTPKGPQWHRDLLSQMTESTSQRDPVITIETAQRLADYLGFRHFYRHSYSYFLDWNELEDLVISLAEVWTQVKTELQIFVGQFDSDSK